jgi:hypothetical protein
VGARVDAGKAVERHAVRVHPLAVVIIYVFKVLDALHVFEHALHGLL